MKRVLIIGGYGNFGRFISRSLANQDNIRLIIAGRSEDKAQSLANTLNAEAAVLDIHESLEAKLQEINPDVVIHTSGPFQQQGYDVAEACISCGANYIDLADGREFVSNIGSLDERAKDAGVLVVSGASSVPCLTSALIDDFQKEFEVLESLDYGITTAQKTTRGLATTAAILGYTGKSFKTLINGKDSDVYGWQSLHGRRYSSLGLRLLGNCNVPDLQLFPGRYPDLKTIRFYVGLELPFIHITLWSLSWLVRIGLIKSLKPTASILLKLSFLFDWLGSANSGFHMDLSGRSKSGEHQVIHFELIAREGDGPFIPCMPVILLAKRLANNQISEKGAKPCIGLISKDEYLDALKELNIEWQEHSA